MILTLVRSVEGQKFVFRIFIHSLLVQGSLFVFKLHLLGLHVLFVLLILLHERPSLLKLAVILGNCISKTRDKIFVLKVSGKNFVKSEKLPSCHIGFKLSSHIERFLNQGAKFIFHVLRSWFAYIKKVKILWNLGFEVLIVIGFIDSNLAERR